MKIIPPCDVFGRCGGCQYQDIPYAKELALKEQHIRALFQDVAPGPLEGFQAHPKAGPSGASPAKARDALGDPGEALLHPEDIIQPIVPSPKVYHYRSRMDMKFLRIKKGDTFMGFTPAPKGYLIEVNKCPIAMEAISDFLPQLKQEASARMPAGGRNANLVVKTGDDGRVYWGGIGRRSLRQREADYLFTEIDGKKVFYSLETFFQANLGILPQLFSCLKALHSFDKQTVLWDLYAGVGLFGVMLAREVAQVVMIEENKHATKVAHYNVAHHGLDNCEVLSGFLEGHETRLAPLRRPPDPHAAPKHVAIIDPPRNGLSRHALKILGPLHGLDALFYLSCQPEALRRDVAHLQQQGWTLTKIIPFDFFPRTRHIETLAVLQPKRE